MTTLLLILLAWLTGGPAAPIAPAGPAYRNLTPGVAYSGDASCATCHAREAGTYPRTAMGRALSLPDAGTIQTLRLPPEGATFLNRNSNRRYRIFVEQGQLKHQEIRLDDQGREAFTDTRTVSHVLGSGDRGQTFLFREGGRLYQSAVALRRHRDGWGMAAGFEDLESYNFARPVTGPCLFCHSNKALYVEGTLNEYREPIFEGLAIGCERCHGPGSLHVAERRSLPPTESGTDTSIVNPRKLPSTLRDSVCFQCHLQGDSRVLKKEHKLFEFRPGLPLSDYFAVYHAEREGAPPAAGVHDAGIEVVSHVERLLQSRCWRASGGEITCLTCHDPHRTPAGADAERQFREACLTCHKVSDCGAQHMNQAAGIGHEGARMLNCVACHMAKVPPSDAPHTLFTDHLIARRPSAPSPAPPSAGGDLRLVNFLERDAGSQRDLGVAYLLFEGKAADARYAERGAAILEPLLPSLPDDFNARRLTAIHYQNRGDPGQAAELLESLVALAPQMAEFSVELGRAYQKLGRSGEALALLERSVSEDPHYAPARLTLGDLLSESGRLDEAEAHHRAAVQIDPSLPLAHVRLGDISIRKKSLDAAREEYRTALLLDPRLASARAGLANVHLARGQTQAALDELRLAVANAGDDRSRTAARFQLARVLAAAGKTPEALAELEQVLAADPAHAGAVELQRRLRSR